MFKKQSGSRERFLHHSTLSDYFLPAFKVGVFVFTGAFVC